MAKEREGLRYLLITFDVPKQEMLKTEELFAPFEGKRQNVTVDWARFMKLIKLDQPKGEPKDPPWERAVIDDDDRTPPWNQTPVEDGEAEEKPPEV